MPLHLIKLCVGADSIADLAAWQKERLAEAKAKGVDSDIRHVTRMTPKRDDELLDGGSLYWVIKGHIAVRQKLTALKPAVKNGKPHCALILDPKLVRTARRFHRPFQGWRYLDPKDAPRDLKKGETDTMPDELHAELSDLGLI